MARAAENNALREAFKKGEAWALKQVYLDLVDELGTLTKRGFIIDRGKQGRVLGLANPSDQRDIVQEVFARAFAEKARASYQSKYPLRPYILRIAKNLMIDRLRRGNREVQPGGKEDPIDIDVLIEKDSEIPESAAELVDRQRLLDGTRDFLQTLEQEEQRFYQLRYARCLPQQEVAQKMDVTRRRVRTLESRFRSALAAFLKKRGLFDLVQ